MKTSLALLLVLLCPNLRLGAAESAPSPGTGQAVPPAGSQPAVTQLAALVSEISASLEPRTTKERRIANAIRLAVTAAIADVRDPAQVLRIAMDFATAAARAAPDFNRTILNSISSIPSIAGISGAVVQLQAAADAGASAAGSPSSVPPPVAPANVTTGGNPAEVVVSPSH